MPNDQLYKEMLLQRVGEGKELIVKAAKVLRDCAHDLDQRADQYKWQSGGNCQISKELILAWVVDDIANILPNLRLDLFVSKAAEITEAKAAFKHQTSKEQVVPELPALSETAEAGSSTVDSMAMVRSAVAEFRKVQTQYSKCGACDTEPSYVYEIIVREALRGGADFVIPRKNTEWQLYSSMEESEKAAECLHLAALGVVQAIWACPMKDRQKLKNYFG